MPECEVVLSDSENTTVTVPFSFQFMTLEDHDDPHRKRVGKFFHHLPPTQIRPTSSMVEPQLPDDHKIAKDQAIEAEQIEEEVAHDSAVESRPIGEAEEVKGAETAEEAETLEHAVKHLPTKAEEAEE